MPGVPQWSIMLLIAEYSSLREVLFFTCKAKEQ